MTKPKYSNKSVTRAGESFLSDDIFDDTEKFNQSMDVLSYWRASHEGALEETLTFLEKEVIPIDSEAIFAKRLKRLPSIISKLRRFSENRMTLRNMQDIGGCRVIVTTPKQQRLAVKALRKFDNFKKESKVKFNDYITQPKDDGYRSYHLYGQFLDSTGNLKKIEVQVRTKLQHIWATTLEIIELFTGEKLKSARGSQDWHRFFILTSKQFSFIEKVFKTKQINFERDYQVYLQQLMKNPQLLEEVVELYELGKSLKVQDILNACTQSIKYTREIIETKDVYGYFLIQLDIDDSSINLDYFKAEDGIIAEQAYTEKEKENADNPKVVTALVHARHVNQLEEAYPNYFADSQEFIEHLTMIFGTVQGIYNALEPKYGNLIN